MNDRMTAFSEPELRALTRAASSSEWWLAFILLGASAGLRPSETLRLASSDIDLDQRTIRVTSRSQHVVEVDDGWWPVFSTPKPSSRDRVVPMSRDTHAALYGLLMRVDSPYLFVPGRRLGKLWPFYDRGLVPRPSDLAPGLTEAFVALQHHAHPLLSLMRASGLAPTRWPIRPLAALRETFRIRVTAHSSPAEVAALMGLRTNPVRPARHEARGGGR